MALKPNTSVVVFDEWTKEGMSRDPARMPSKTVASLEKGQRVNTSLQLCERENFLGMCKDLLWGNETEEDLGEMLRGLAIEYLPGNRQHLYLLKNVAGVQMQIDRVLRLQRNLSLAPISGTDANGVQRRAIVAMDYNAQLSDLMAMLQKAIATYKFSKRK